MLTLLTSPLNLEVLRAVEEGPQPLQELMRRLGFPPRSTARLYLRGLVELGAVERRARNEFPTSVDYEITAAGRALLEVATTLQAWLDRTPGGGVELGSTAAKSAIKALVEGWGSNIVRALSTRPLSLTELNRLIPRISYPSLERRLTAMRQVGLLEAAPSTGRSSPCAATDWLRLAVPPVTAAIGWERRFAPRATSDLRRLDVEASFLLLVPLIEPPEALSGRCRLAVEVHEGASPAPAGVVVSIAHGEVLGCIPSLEGEAEGWAWGKPRAWLPPLAGGGAEGLEIGGDARLTRAVISAIRRTTRKPQ
ncbi:MAG TPA: winged helix-turn-helix transcriptional regulator [Solirubrobacterales bacterium]|nr:winged helix-turn-helix transcriptional regulator [Solirubrobacterales bacterium]